MSFILVCSSSSSTQVTKDPRLPLRAPGLTMPEPFSSPNPIPPRTSSHGGTNSVSSININWNTVLKPVPEDEWIASSSRRPDASTTPKVGHKRARSSVDNSKPTDAMWTEEREKIILGPYEYLLQQPGKDIRSQLITAFNHLLQVPEQSLAIITKVVGMLHTSSLLYVFLSPLSLR